VSGQAATQLSHADVAVDDALARRALSSTHRRDVLWIGGDPPLGLRRDCETNGLALVSVPPDADALRRAAPTARAVVLELGAALGEAARDASAADATGSVARLFAVARLHGLLVAVTHSSTVSPQAYYEAAAALDDPSRIRPPVVAAYRDWLEITRQSAAHDPGPGEHAAL
jgi:hypothetical protein